jgi:hypothetical protein
MPERSERILRIACICLAALLLFQFARLVLRKDPLKNLSIPALPSLPPAADARASGSRTNPPSRPGLAGSGTNAPAAQEPGRKGTNPVPEQALAKTETNSVAARSSSKTGTNSLARPASGTKGTNSVSDQELAAPATAAMPRPGPGHPGVDPGSPPEMALMGMNPMSRQGPGRRGPPLPPAIQARVDRIVDSELLAPIIRPLPMALFGIAGQNAFLRAPNGQTGMVKEGEELGGVKLLRIGTNRVLVEQDGQKKELMVFAGFGGESLLPKEKESPQ